MLSAERVEYRRAARGDVSENASPCALREFRKNVFGESMGISRKGLRQMYPGNLPMPCGAVLSRGRRIHCAPRGEWRGRPADTVERRNVSEPTSLEVWEIESANRRRNVPERVASGVAISGGIGRVARANAVEDDYRRTFQISRPRNSDSGGSEGQ